jgi:hypothetical protein
MASAAAPSQVARALSFVGAAIPGSNPPALLARLIQGGQTAGDSARFLVATALMLHSSPSSMVH